MPVQYRSKRIKALEQGLPALEACGDNVLVQFLLNQVMHGHLVLLAAFFVESQPPARSTVAAATIIGNGLSDGSSMLEIKFSKTAAQFALCSAFNTIVTARISFPSALRNVAR